MIPRLGLLALGALAACHQGPPSDRAATDRAVALEALAIESHAAYTDVRAIEAGPAGRVQRRDAAVRGAQLVPWAAVEKEPLRYLGGAIERDSFGLRDRLDDVVDLLARTPGSLSITWDGGLAQTDAERELAASRRVAAVAWPDDLPRPERSSDDPLNPRRLLDR